MRRFVNPGKRIASFTRTFARMRWALMFDGVGVRGQLANRAINPDGDIDIEWEQLDYDTTSFGASSIVTQCLTATFASRELMLRIESNESIALYLGGNIVTTPVNFYGTGKWRITLIGSSWIVYKNGLVVHSASFTRGAAREPSAQTVIGARNNGGTFVDYKKGTLYNVKINGTRWPMADRNQAIQLPEPSGLGGELITPELLANPNEKGTQWSYLGGGRWQLIGDGSLNQLRFISSAEQPNAGFLEFEIESLTGIILCTDDAIGSAQFNTVGLKRYFYTTKANGGNALGAATIFKRFPGSVASCIIKNISFKPLGTCNPMTISNATSANWMQVVDDYVRKFRSLLNFDGVGIRGALANRVINPDGDNTFEFWSPETSGVIIAQNIVATVNLREFTLYGDALGLYMNIGGVDNVICTAAQGFELGKKYWLTLVGSNFTLAKNTESNIIRSASFTKGAAREPTAQTIIGARANGTASAFSTYFKGIQRDIKINGTLWPIADRNQSIQLPDPSGLGAELLNTSPFLEPNGYVNTIVTTGINSFKVLAPASGATRAAKAFVLPSVSETTILEFDFISKDPDALLSVFVRDGSIVGGGAVTFSGNISALGKHRFLVTNSSMVEKNILFAVNVPCTFEVRNISIKPLGTCNPLTLANVTSANWEDLEI